MWLTDVVDYNTKHGVKRFGDLFDFFADFGKPHSARAADVRIVSSLRTVVNSHISPKEGWGMEAPSVVVGKEL
jgi:hypothetical protein